MDIAFVSADWSKPPKGVKPSPGGAGWVRIHQPAHQLERHGHRVVVGSGVAVNEKEGFMVPLDHHGQGLMMNAEIVVVQRWMHADSARAVRDARAYGQTVIHDVDDWFWGLDPANKAHKNTSKRHNPEYNRDNYKDSITSSDAVTVSTEFLAKRIRERMGVDTYLVRNAIDGSMYATQPVTDKTSRLVVGWTGALAWRSGDLETLAPFLPDFLRDTKSTFVHHGVFPDDTDTAADRIGLPPELVGLSKPACHPIDYPNNVAGFDIGVVPLKDVPFNHAKSWIKGLEYAAAGIPFVAADTAEYRALGCGLIAKTPKQWRAALDRLTDPAERAAQAKLGREVAKAHDLRTRWVDWETAYQVIHSHR